MKTNQSISSSNSNQASLVDYVNRVLKLGLDVHYRQVTVAKLPACGERSLRVALGNGNDVGLAQSCRSIAAAGHRLEAYATLHRSLTLQAPFANGQENSGCNLATS